MVVGVQMVCPYLYLFSCLPAFRNYDSSGGIIHLQLRLQYISLQHFFQRLCRLTRLRVKKAPQGIGISQPVSLLICHQKISEPDKSFNLIRHRANHNAFSQPGITLHHNLPGGKHPNQMLFP